MDVRTTEVLHVLKGPVFSVAEVSPPEQMTVPILIRCDNLHRF